MDGAHARCLGQCHPAKRLKEGNRYEMAMILAGAANLLWLPLMDLRPADYL
jgi:hypothetical protein